MLILSFGKYLERIRVIKGRWRTAIYCSECMIVIGEFHKRQNDKDFFNCWLCQCDDPIPSEIELQEIKEFLAPTIDYIKDRDYNQGQINTSLDLNRGKALRRWDSSRSRWVY